MRWLAILLLAVGSALAIRAEYATELLSRRDFYAFPLSALVGTFATGLALRLGLPGAWREFAADVSELLALFAIGTIAFVVARWGVMSIYVAGASRLPVSTDVARWNVGLGLVAITVALLVATFGWTEVLRHPYAPLRRSTPAILGVAMLAVIPSATAVVALLGDPTNLPNVIASGWPTFFTVAYAGLAARAARPAAPARRRADDGP